MRILANEQYSDALTLTGYESLTLTSDVDLECRLIISDDSFVWKAFNNTLYHLSQRVAWTVPAGVMAYQYLKLQVAPSDTYRTITAVLTNLETSGIPVATGNNQFMYASLAGIGLVPAPVGTGLEVPCLRGGTPAVHRNYYASANPTANDDVNDGFNVLSMWFNTATGNLFLCIDTSVGAAIWKQIITNPLTALGDLMHGGANGVPTGLAGNTTVTRKYLSQIGDGEAAAAPTWETIYVSPLSALGDLLYGGTAGAATRLAGNTTATRKYLSQIGDGEAAAAPTWEILTAAGIGAVAVPGSPGTAELTTTITDSTAKTCIEQLQNVLITAGLLVAPA